jgi:hypothetical protein
MGKVCGHPKEQGADRWAPASPEVVIAGAPRRDGDAGSVPTAWERLRSRDLAVKIFVAGATYVARRSRSLSHRRGDGLPVVSDSSEIASATTGGARRLRRRSLRGDARPRGGGVRGTRAGRAARIPSADASVAAIAFVSGHRRHEDPRGRWLGDPRRGHVDDLRSGVWFAIASLVLRV